MNWYDANKIILPFETKKIIGLSKHKNTNIITSEPSKVIVEPSIEEEILELLIFLSDD